MSMTSPTLGLPMIDKRCSTCSGDAYRLVGYCLNCRTDLVGLFTAGHRPGYFAACPGCGVDYPGNIKWHGLEDAKERS